MCLGLKFLIGIICALDDVRYISPKGLSCPKILFAGGGSRASSGLVDQRKIAPLAWGRPRVQIPTSPYLPSPYFPGETEIFRPCFDFNALFPSILSNLRVRPIQSCGPS